MIFSSLVSVIFTEIVKPLMAVVISLILAISSAFTGPAGEYMKLSGRLLQLDPVHTNVSVSANVNVKAISALSGEEFAEPDFSFEIKEPYSIAINGGNIAFSGNFDLYTDLENLRASLVLPAPEGKSYTAYLDTSAFAVSPDLTYDAIKLLGLSASEFSGLYEKHMAGKGFYVDFNESMGTIPEHFGSEAQDIVQKANVLITEVGKAMTSREGIDKLLALYKDTFEIESKYFSEKEIDGAKAYGISISGKQLVQYCSEINGSVLSEEYFRGYFEYIKYLMDSVDVVGTLGLDEEAAQVYNNVKNSYFGELPPELTRLLPEMKAQSAAVCSALLTGENTEILDGLEVIIPYLENSFVSSYIYEKDGKTVETQEILISDGEATLVSLAIVTTVEKYDSKIMSPAEALPFDSRMTAEQLSYKLAYEKAIAKGVNSVEIDWYSDMTPEDAVPYVYGTFFVVNYNTPNPDYADYMENPAYTEQQKASIRQMILDGYGNETSHNDSSAHLIDGSIYLPLRQIMECAGYRVSWDVEARKAYVTVGTETIDMTGTIINNKTYVKIRDFEKLGATVDYSETFFHSNAYNDFSKSCYATISFAK